MPPNRPDEPQRSIPLSRRRLLFLSALAGAAGSFAGTFAPTGTPASAGAPTPDGALARATPVRTGGSGDDAAYQYAFDRMVSETPKVRRFLAQGREFLYRPRQLLTADADVTRVQGWLRSRDYPTATVRNRFAGMTKMTFDQEVDIPTLVKSLRDPKEWPNGRAAVAQPHHVTVGFGNIMGNPGGPPQVSAALPPPDPARAGEGAGVTVGVCDTGIWRYAGAWHPAWLGGTYLPELDDEDPLYVSGDLLALQGGHGTFVAGVVRQGAPGVSLDPEQALDASGLGDEEMLVGALSRLSPAVSIINLSLGCYTLDDLPPTPLVNAINNLPGGTVVIASAGNSGGTRPSWPAALSKVVAVSAVQSDGGVLVPAPYSNHGPWLDACAVGDWTSTYVKGRLVLPGVPEKTFLGFADWAGTSFATAYVSGRLAAMMTAGAYDALTAREILLSDPVWHPSYGVLVP